MISTRDAEDSKVLLHVAVNWAFRVLRSLFVDPSWQMLRVVFSVGHIIWHVCRTCGYPPQIRAHSSLHGLRHV